MILDDEMTLEDVIASIRSLCRDQKEVKEMAGMFKDKYLPGETWYIKYPHGSCLVEAKIISSTDKTVELESEGLIGPATVRYEWEDIKFVEEVEEK